MIPFSCQTIASRLGDGYDFVRVCAPVLRCLVIIYRPGRHSDLKVGGAAVEKVYAIQRRRLRSPAGDGGKLFAGGECLASDALHTGREVDGGEGVAAIECGRFDARHPVRDVDGGEVLAVRECHSSDVRQLVREFDRGEVLAVPECVFSEARDTMGQLDGREGNKIIIQTANVLAQVICIIGGTLKVESLQCPFVLSDGIPVGVVQGAARHGDGDQVGAAAYQAGELAASIDFLERYPGAINGNALDGGAALHVVQDHKDFACAGAAPYVGGGGDVEGELGAGGAGLGDVNCPALGSHDEEVVRGEVSATSGGALYDRCSAVEQGEALRIERQADACAGHLEDAAVGQGESDVVGVRRVDAFKEAVAFRASSASVALFALLAADARPRLSAVHAQVDGVGLDVFVLRVGVDTLFGELRACGQLGQRGVVAGGSLFALRAVGSDGVAVGVGQELAVQRPVPVAVVILRGAYLWGVARVTLVALRAVVDGDGGCVQEADGEAHLHAVLHDGRHGGDVVRGAE